MSKVLFALFGALVLAAAVVVLPSAAYADGDTTADRTVAKERIEKERERIQKERERVRQEIERIRKQRERIREQIRERIAKAKAAQQNNQ